MELKQRLIEIMKNPLPLPQIENVHQGERNLAGKYLQGEISRVQFHQAISDLQDQIPTLAVYSLAELKFVLHLLNIPEDETNEAMQWMTFEYKRASEYYHQVRIGVWIYQVPYNKKLYAYIGVQINV